MCEVHTTRAILKNRPRKCQGNIADWLREAYGNEERVQALADELKGEGCRKALNTIGRFLPELLNYTAFPKAHQKRIRTTNGMKRINKELKRRTKVIGAFPNEDSLLRLVGAIFMDINEDWVTNRRSCQLMRNDPSRSQGSANFQKDRDATNSTTAIGD